MFATAPLLSFDESFPKPNVFESFQDFRDVWRGPVYYGEWTLFCLAILASSREGEIVLSINFYIDIS